MKETQFQAVAHVERVEKVKKNNNDDGNNSINNSNINISYSDKHKSQTEKQKEIKDIFAKQETNEKLACKGISKDIAAQTATNSSNFLQIYPTPEGYCVADGAVKGGLFLRNFCVVFKDRDFVSKHHLSDIILKIREYTKREATIISNLTKFTIVLNLKKIIYILKMNR